MNGRSTAVVWFRRDLRLHDHPALSRAVAEYDQLMPLFVLDEALLLGRAASPNRIWFMTRSVAELGHGLAERGSALTVLRGDPWRLVPGFAEAVGADDILVSRDYAPYGRRRDRRVGMEAQRRGIGLRAQSGLLVHEPEQIERSDGGHFTVFSPFRRAWQALPLRRTVPAPDAIRSIPTRPEWATASLEQLLGPIRPTADVSLLPRPGEQAARRRLAEWSQLPALTDYAHGRDRLDRPGTSRLSQDLRWGLLSPVDVLHRTAGRGEGRQRFASEICWRDFYAHLLWHEPRLLREAFRRELEGLAWSADAEAAEAWREGRTGYPVVDAAMRQLRASGWMHNRARMIVASFLTKHLGLDWRVGEAHFMAHLLDGDVASNNGGWQWAASTGTDPQPYFRVFNPTLQAERHDPSGDYVRRWLPDRSDYPSPIVDHAAARRRAIAAFEARTAGKRTPA